MNEISHVHMIYSIGAGVSYLIYWIIDNCSFNKCYGKLWYVRNSWQLYVNKNIYYPALLDLYLNVIFVSRSTTPMFRLLHLLRVPWNYIILDIRVLSLCMWNCPFMQTMRMTPENPSWVWTWTFPKEWAPWRLGPLLCHQKENETFPDPRARTPICWAL